jgi:hypothetical protein
MDFEITLYLDYSRYRSETGSKSEGESKSESESDRKNEGESKEWQQP